MKDEFTIYFLTHNLKRAIAERGPLPCVRVSATSVSTGYSGSVRTLTWGVAAYELKLNKQEGLWCRCVRKPEDKYVERAYAYQAARATGLPVIVGITPTYQDLDALFAHYCKEEV